MYGVPQVPSVNVSDLSPGVFLVDIREDDEWSEGRAPGALHVPLQTLPERLSELPADAPVYLICRSGSRSAYAAAWLGQQGIEAFNVDGGMLEWAAAGRPMEGDTDTPVVR